MIERDTRAKAVAKARTAEDAARELAFVCALLLLPTLLLLLLICP